MRTGLESARFIAPEQFVVAQICLRHSPGRKPLLEGGAGGASIEFADAPVGDNGFVLVVHDEAGDAIIVSVRRPLPVLDYAMPLINGVETTR